MQLNDFVEQVLVQNVEGTRSAKKITAKDGARINDPDVMPGSAYTEQWVDFDVAVTVE